MSRYYENLIATVIDHSEATKWDDAVQEWDLFDWEEDESASSFCTCGKEGLRYLYTIRNHYNGEMLYPIGSCCIKKFNRSDMTSEIDTQEQMFRLLHAIREQKFIPLTTEFFSRNLLLKLKEVGAFAPSAYNGNSGDNDYTFLLDMFNKRDKASISQAQQRKINGIIAFSIKPYLERELANKIRLARTTTAGISALGRFRPLFTDVIWERGEDLAAAGAVLRYSRSPSVIQAEVQGQSRYQVRIMLDGTGAPASMNCTCPYAADGNNCKHMAAVLIHGTQSGGQTKR